MNCYSQALVATVKFLSSSVNRLASSLARCIKSSLRTLSVASRMLVLKVSKAWSSRWPVTLKILYYRLKQLHMSRSRPLKCGCHIQALKGHCWLRKVTRSDTKRSYMLHVASWLHSRILSRLQGPYMYHVATKARITEVLLSTCALCRLEEYTRVLSPSNMYWRMCLRQNIALSSREM